MWWNLHDRNPGSEFDVVVRATPSVTARLRAGFGRRVINPDMSKPVWVAGFAHNRAATKIHDDLKAVAAVIDDGEHRIGVVALDAIGFFHDEVLAVRRSVPSSARLDYVIVASTHNHSAPDLMGIWGPSDFVSGIDPAYRRAVVAGAAGALIDAVEALTPATVSHVEVPLAPPGLVADSRDPQVFDNTMRLMLFATPEGRTIGSIVNWANHPETPWADNTELTADFPGLPARRARVGHHGGWSPGGRGARRDARVRQRRHRRADDDEPGHDGGGPVHAAGVCRAVARQGARGWPPVGPGGPGGRARWHGGAADRARLAFAARTIELRIDNGLFRLASALGLFGRGQPRLNTIRSEVSVVTFGDASVACVPGELYPEIANGGIVRPPGADFDVAPVEVPALRELMPGRFRFLIGLANDEVGYIIPKSEWDNQAPWLYGSAQRHYGEINSLGPETGPQIHAALKALAASLSERQPALP